MSRPVAHDDALREKMLQEAVGVIAASGTQALSLRGLAAASGTSTMAVYRLFGGREELLSQALARVATAFVTAQRQAPQHQDPLENLLELARAYRSWGLGHPEEFTVLFARPELFRQSLDETSLDPGVPLVARISQAVRQGVMAGPAEQIAATLWSVVHGYTALELAGTLPTGKDEAFEQAVRAALRGWQPKR